MEEAVIQRCSVPKALVCELWVWPPLLQVQRLVIFLEETHCLGLSAYRLILKLE